MKTIVKFIEDPIIIADYLDGMANNEHGAQDIFVGKVRVNNMNRTVVGIEYEIFDELALNVINELCTEARKEIEQMLDFTVIHRKGYLVVGEISVLIIASSKHRDESFRGCRFMIEEIKHRVPIWKQETYTDGQSEWVQGHALCQHH